MAKKAKKTKAKKAKAKAKSAKKTKRAVKKTKRAVKKTKRAVKKIAGVRSKIKKVVAFKSVLPPARLVVKATVEVPNPGYIARLNKVPQGINPAVLLLRVVTKRSWVDPPIATDVEARYDIRNYKGNFTQVRVLYGKESRTADVETVI
jgi:hypothetical protein